MSTTTLTDLLADQFALDGNASTTAVVQQLVVLRELKKQLGAIEDEMVEWLAPLLPKAGLVVEGVGFVKPGWSPRSPKWDSEGLVRVLVARALDERHVDPETGEYEREAEAVARVLAQCAPFTPSMKWRTTPLKERGISIDEYRETQGWKPGVQIT